MRPLPKWSVVFAGRYLLLHAGHDLLLFLLHQQRGDMYLLSREFVVPWWQRRAAE